MNVLFVSNIGSSFGGNFIESLIELDKTVRNEGGCTYHVFNEPAQKSNWINCFENVFFTDWSSGSLKKIIDKLINECGVNIIQYSYIEWKKALLLRFLVGNRAKFVFYFLNHICTSDGVLKHSIKQGLCRLAFDNTYKICMTKGVADSVSIISKDNVIVIKNPVNLARLNTVGVTSSIDDDGKTIKLFMFGNHYKRKGVDIAAVAVRKLRENGENVQLYVAASCAAEIYSWLETIMPQKNLRDFVHVIPTRNDIATYYKRTDILLSPSREEGYTWAIPEAMYCGCQAIATNISGQNEHTIPGIYWVSDPATKSINEMSEQLANSIMEAYYEEKSSRYSELLQERLSFIRMYNDMNKWAMEYIDVYKKALQGR